MSEDDKRKAEMKALVDICRDKCVENVREMFKEIDLLCAESSEQEKNGVKYLLQSRVTNYLWSKAHPHAIEIMQQVYQDEIIGG